MSIFLVWPPAAEHGEAEPAGGENAGAFDLDDAAVEAMAELPQAGAGCG